MDPTVRTEPWGGWRGSEWGAQGGSPLRGSEKGAGASPGPYFCQLCTLLHLREDRFHQPVAFMLPSKVDHVCLA